MKVGDVIMVRREGRLKSAVITDTRRGMKIPVCYNSPSMCWFATKECITGDCIVGKPRRKYKWTKKAINFLKKEGTFGKHV